MFKKILSLSTPVIITYLTVGATYGMLAENSGLSFLFTVLMSIFVYAGTAQLLAVGLVESGASAIVLATSVFVVNLRYFLYSSILLKYIDESSLLKKVLFSLEVTDETFIVQSSTLKPGDLTEGQLFLMHHICHLSWIFGSVVGYLIGEKSFDISKYGGDFALPIMFVALLALSIKEPFHWFLAIISSGLFVILNIVGLGQFAAILGSIMAAFSGVWIKRYVWK